MSQQPPPGSAPPVLLSTMNELPGFRVAHVYGDVFGLTVRSRNVFSNIGAGFKSLAGGEIHQYTKMISDSRHEALTRLRQAAAAYGANAVLAMRFDCNEIAQTMSEIAAYGTAVYVVPAQQQPQPGAPAQPPAHPAPPPGPPSHLPQPPPAPHAGPLPPGHAGPPRGQHAPPPGPSGPAGRPAPESAPGDPAGAPQGGRAEPSTPPTPMPAVSAPGSSPAVSPAASSPADAPEAAPPTPPAQPSTAP